MMGTLPAGIGPYRVSRKLGEGGMGAVYEAVHQTIQRRVAIKVLHPEAGRGTEMINRFINEARAANLIHHPGLVQITDFGSLPDGAGYLVMEYLQGETLGSRLEASGGKLSPEDAVQIGIQIASALAACHKKGIIHRDLKPGNTMLVPDAATATGERLKVLDFGLAKLSEVREAALVKTDSLAVFGTPLYMSPEQCEGAGRVDAKTDVYALGCMLYEMLAGRPPFLGEGPGQVIGKHMFMEPEPLAKLAPQLPVALTDLVHRLLVKSKDGRPSMRETQKALEALAETLPAPQRREVEPSGIMTADTLSTMGLATTLRPEPGEAISAPSNDPMVFAPTVNPGMAGPGMVNPGMRSLPQQSREQLAAAPPAYAQPAPSASVTAAPPSRRTVLLGAALFCALIIVGLIGLLHSSSNARPELPAPRPAVSVVPPQAPPAAKPAESEVQREKATPEPKKKLGRDGKPRNKKKPSNGRFYED